MIAFVQSQPRCFERGLLIGHITGSAWLLDATGRRVLLTHHRKLNKWLQLGGHADGNPDVLDVALREAREESGIHEIAAIQDDIFDLDVHPIPARGDEPAHFHYDVRFLLRVCGDEVFQISEESHDLRWLTVEEIPALGVGQSVMRMRSKWMKMIEEEKL